MPICKNYSICNNKNPDSETCGNDSFALGYCGIRKDYELREKEMNPEQRNLFEKLFTSAQPFC